MLNIIMLKYTSIILSFSNCLKAPILDEDIIYIQITAQPDWKTDGLLPYILGLFYYVFAGHYSYPRWLP